MQSLAAAGAKGILSLHLGKVTTVGAEADDLVLLAVIGKEVAAIPGERPCRKQHRGDIRKLRRLKIGARQIVRQTVFVVGGNQVQRAVAETCAANFARS